MKVLNSIFRGIVPTLLMLSASIAYSAEEYADIIQRMQMVRPDIKFESIEPSPVEGIYKASVERGPTLYITGDGRYFFAGDFFEVTDNGLVNILEQELEAEREELLAGLDKNDMIIFKAENKKAHIYVFTDVDCYYCQKLHREIADINGLGIEVRYLAYPRAGIGSPSYRKISSAWCAEDRNEALTQLKSGKEIPENVCAENPVASQYDLGGRIGVSGTPAIVTSDGKMLPGYKPAAQLAQSLGIK